MWEAGIRATGGGIKGTKSDFAVVNFKWDKGKWKYSSRNANHRLWVPDGKGGREYLTQLQYHELRQTLGVWQAVDRNEVRQTEVMTKKALQWSRNARTGFLLRNDIVFGVKTSLYLSITFGLMATALDQNQCSEVFKPIQKHALSPMGYNTNMPKIVVHGLTQYRGMGLWDIYTV